MGAANEYDFLTHHLLDCVASSIQAFSTYMDGYTAQQASDLADAILDTDTAVNFRLFVGGEEQKTLCIEDLILAGQSAIELYGNTRDLAPGTLREMGLTSFYDNRLTPNHLADCIAAYLCFCATWLGPDTLIEGNPLEDHAELLLMMTDISISDGFGDFFETNADVLH